MSVYRNPVAQNEWKLLEKASGTTTASADTVLDIPANQELLSSYDEILIKVSVINNLNTGSSKGFGVGYSTAAAILVINSAYTSVAAGTVYTGDLHLFKIGYNSPVGGFASVYPTTPIGTSAGPCTCNASTVYFWGFDDKNVSANRVSALGLVMYGTSACNITWSYKIYGKKYDLPD